MTIDEDAYGLGMLTLHDRMKCMKRILNIAHNLCFWRWSRRRKLNLKNGKQEKNPPKLINVS